MAFDQYDVVLDRVIYQDYKFLVNQMKKKMKGRDENKENNKKALAFIRSAKDYIKELKYKMSSMSEKELDEKFNEVMNDPDNKILSDDVKKMTIAIESFLYNVKDDEDDDENDKIIEEADRLDKTKSLNDLVYLPKKTQENIKDMTLKEFLEYVD